MTAQSTKYYGYDKATYEDCRQLIDDTNWNHINILSLWFIIVNLFCVIFSLLDLFSVNQVDIEFYITYGAISICNFAFSRWFQKKYPHKFVKLQLIFGILLWMVYSIQLSVSQPYMAATMFMIMLVVISFSFITNMLNMLMIIAVLVSVFVYSSYLVKPASIVMQDIYNAVTFTGLAVILHFAFQRTRMQQFVTYQKNTQIQRELEIQSSFDALTSLLNRGRFFSLAGNVLNNPHDEYMAVCLLDLDEFKQINDRLGHQMGDKAIQVAGTTIIETLNIDMSEKWRFQEKVLEEKQSFPGRLGGDEFIVMIRGASDREEVIKLLQSMLDSLNHVEIGELHGIYASFGVAEILPEDRDIDKAYKRADEALYESKRAGKNQIRFSNVEGQGGGL